MFGERYPDPVRVLSVGQEVVPMLEDPENPAWDQYSIEFCGGTHLANTKEAERFALLDETGKQRMDAALLAVFAAQSLD